jgi:4-hydroxy-tetrahydrodipicolinate synthase
MTPATMGELAKLPRIVGVKDATGDVSRVSDQRAACGADFIQLSGEDASALGFNAQGGVGCISVVANIAPRLCSEFQEAMLAGDYAQALDYQDRLLPLHRAAFAEPSPGPTKFALSVLGKCSEELRSPILPVEAPTRERMRDAMRHAGLIN